MTRRALECRRNDLSDRPVVKHLAGSFALLRTVCTVRSLGIEVDDVLETERGMLAAVGAACASASAPQ